MWRRAGERGVVLPAYYYIICVVVESVANDSVMFAVCNDGGIVFGGRLPVAAVIHMSSGGVGQTQRDGRMSLHHSCKRWLVSDRA